jgi:hypothetical protein
MQLSPVSTGSQMLGDAMPHAWSLLQAFSPGHDATVEALRFSTREIDSPELTVEFRFKTESALVESTVRLAQSKSQPREAGFGIDGFWAKRLIRMEDYSILFGDGPRIVDVPDPLGLLVTDFVRGLASPSDATAGSRADQIVQRMQLLDYVVTEYERGND